MSLQVAFALDTLYLTSYLTTCDVTAFVVICSARKTVFPEIFVLNTF
jgi:hypothetical protein